MAMRFSTVFSVLEAAAEAHGKSPALYQPIPGTRPVQYTIYTWREFRQAAIEIACGLHAIGLRKGDVVSLHSETRAEFYLADLGTMACGGVSAAVYTASPLPEILKNIHASCSKWIFAEDPKTMKMLREFPWAEPLEAEFILMTGRETGVRTMDDVRERGRAALAKDPHHFARIHAEVQPEDNAIIYSTSGATGEPKLGVVTHRAVTSNLEMAPYVLPLTSADRTLAFLPSAHIAQRVVVEFVPLVFGVPVWFSESLMRMPMEMQAVKPTFLLAPPRVWERIYASVRTEIMKRGGLSQKIFYSAVGLGLKAAEYRQNGQRVPLWMAAPLKLASRLVFRKIRERLGGALRLPLSGAAPLGKDLAMFFGAIGLPLIEGYGLTEGGVTMLNPVARPKAGSIGKPLPGIHVKVAEDGELLIHSSTLFSGYLNDPDATATVLKDGWLYTGDVADIDNDGYVWITGRKKELLVSSNGKKIYPARIETLFKNEPLISQVVLAGDRLPFVVALITINAAAAEALKGMEEWKGRDLAEIVAADPVQQEVKKAVGRINRALASYEQVRKFKVLPAEFTVSAGEVTPTMKVRRSKVLEKYKDVVNEMYAGKEESH